VCERESVCVYTCVCVRERECVCVEGSSDEVENIMHWDRVRSGFE